MAALPSLPSLCRLTFLLSFSCLSLTSAAKTCKKLDTCSCKMDDGSGIISLQDLDHKDGTPSFTGIKDTVNKDYKFDWNPCTPLKAAGPCKGSNACQRTPDLFPVGKPDTTFSVNPDGTVLITYEKVTYEDHGRKLQVTLKCDATEKGSFGDGISESGVGEESKYTGTFTSKCSCAGKCSYSSSYFSSGHGPSVGSILLIIFFSLLVMYFVLGIVVNKYAIHKEGSDVIPNRSFWSDLPFLIKDGCVFFGGKVKGCCSSLCSKVKGDESYTEI
ncbi:uncharacterized protein LOC116305648 [Actinia tenebrosa]|uniref:Uncharacterized protein LOC116305648 n=1 Tax=Actinia tenebrosa TaxID=6105 RepID=A0A6P8IWH0_ACTTE|nr:uncharacterized protein LOC116305648 [Actinia tenebrosa]